MNNNPVRFAGANVTRETLKRAVSNHAAPLIPDSSKNLAQLAKRLDGYDGATVGEMVDDAKAKFHAAKKSAKQLETAATVVAGGGWLTMLALTAAMVVTKGGALLPLIALGAPVVGTTEGGNIARGARHSRDEAHQTAKDIRTMKAWAQKLDGQ